MPELSEPDERSIRSYVDNQGRGDDPVTLVQQVGSRRIMGQSYELYDVHCEKTRWWVITEPTNLYQQSDFPEVEQAFIFHLGLGLFLADRSRAELQDPEDEQHISTAWRRFRQAIDAMNGAEESEDFQAVGIKCRDTLIALAKEHAGAEWIGELGEDPPKAADFKGWGNIFAERLTAGGRLRQYVKELVNRTWDLTVWLQHEGNATPLDAEIVLDATGLLLGLFAKLINRQEHGGPERCPVCDSYRVRHDIEEDEERDGTWSGPVCASCGWEDRTFETWEERFAKMDPERVKAYLEQPGIVSDRLGGNNFLGRPPHLSEHEMTQADTFDQGSSQSAWKRVLKRMTPKRSEP